MHEDKYDCMQYYQQIAMIPTIKEFQIMEVEFLHAMDWRLEVGLSPSCDFIRNQLLSFTFDCEQKNYSFVKKKSRAGPTKYSNFHRAQKMKTCTDLDAC
mgnify:CR=1 FL=1